MKKTLIGIILILATIALLVLTSCAVQQEVIYEDSFEWGGMYVERDTIINGDTLYFWEGER